MLCPRWGVLEQPFVHNGFRFLPKEHYLKLKSTLVRWSWSHISPAWKYLQFLKTMFQFTPGPEEFYSVIAASPFLFLPPNPALLQPVVHTWTFHRMKTAAAAAKSLQSCLTLCDPRDGSPPGSPVPGILWQEHWSGLPFPSPMHESKKWKWSHSVMSNS